MVRWLVDTDSGDWTGSGYDAQYSNLETAMADAYDLVAATESLTIECTSSAGILADTTDVVVNATWNTSADYTLTIKAHENDEHGGVWDDFKYRLVGVPFYVLVPNVIVNYIQINRNDLAGMVCFSFTEGVSFNNCIGKNSNFCFSRTGDSGSDCFVNNCIAYDCQRGFQEPDFWLQVAWENCLAYNCTVEGFKLTHSSQSVNNCIAVDCTTDFALLGYDASSDYNVSSDLTAPGINNVQSFDHSTLFPNAATGDFRPSIPYVDAWVPTWGAGAIPWQRDVVVDTSEAEIASDNFDRADGGLGSDWTDAPIIGEIADTIAIVSNVAASDTGTAISYYTGKTFSDNQVAYATITSLNDIGLVLRFSISSGYTVLFSGGYCLVQKMVSAASTLIGGLTSYTVSLDDIIEFSAYGDLLTVKVNGVTIKTVTDASFTSGSPGIILVQSSINNFNASTFSNYTSLASAESGEQLIGDDLALRNEKMLISCTSGGTTNADTTAVTIDANWNTSEACDFTVQGEADGVWDDEKYSLTITGSGPALYIYGDVNNITLNTLQIKMIMTGNGAYCIRTTASPNDETTKLTLRNNYLWVVPGGWDYGAIMRASGPGSGGYFIYTYINNIIRGANTIAEGYGLWHAIWDTVYASNNVFYNLRIGIEKTSTIRPCEIFNNIAFDCTDYCYPSNYTVFGTNISSDGTAPDNSTSYTVYDAAIDTLPVVPEDCVIFKDLANNDFRLVSHFVEDYTGTMVETNSAIGNGTYLADLSVDNAGKSRQPYDFKGIRTARAFDIGAWQAPAQLTYMVDTDGVSGDYGNLATAFADVQTDCKTDLVTENMLPTISCQASTGVVDDTAVVIEAIEVDMHCYISVVGDGINGNYIAAAPSGTSIYVDSIDYMVISDIRVETPATSFDYALRMVSVNSYFVQKVIIDTKNNIETGSYGLAVSSSVGGTIDSCIVFGGGATGGGLIATTSTDFSSIVSNCTVCDCAGNGIYSALNDLTITNCISINNGNTDFACSGTSTNNISSDGSGQITGLTSDYFTDPANGDFTPVASAGALTSYSANLNSTVTVGAIPYIWEGVVDGVEYANLATWDVDAVNEAVSGETVRANCGEIEDTQAVTLTAYPAGVNIEIIGDNDTGVWDDTKYRVNNVAEVAAIYLDSNNITLKSFAVKQASIAYAGIQADIYNDHYTLSDIIVDGGKDGIRFGTTTGSVGNWDFRNLVIYNTFNSGIYAIPGADALAAGARASIRNCTTYNTNVANIDYRHGISVANEIAIVNCAVFNTPNGTYKKSIIGTASETIVQNCVGSSGSTTFDKMIASDFAIAPAGDDYSLWFTNITAGSEDFHTTDSPYELWGADAAYAGAFGDEPYEVGILVDTDAVTVSPISGVNHPSLSNAVSWFQTNRADLVERNEKALINCQASTSVADTTAVNINNNITTSADNTLTIQSDGWDGDYKLELTTTGNYQEALQVYIENIFILDLKVEGILASASHVGFTGVYCNTASGVKLKNCLCIISTTDNNIDPNHSAFAGGTSNYIIIENCVADFQSGALGIGYNLATGIGYVYNSVVYRGNRGTTRGHTVVNCICIDQVDNCYRDSWALTTFTNCISSDTTATGANSHTLETALNLFVDAAGGDFRLKSTATNTTDSFTYSDGVITTVSGGNGVVWGWVSGTDAVVNSNAVTQPTGDSVYKFITEVPGAALQTVSADIIVSDASGAFDQLGIAARVTDTSNFYFAELVFGGVYLWSRVAGVWEELGYYPVTVVEKTYNLKLSISDSAKRVFLDDTEVIVSTDNSLTTGDHVGLRLLANNLDASLDNFTVSVQENPAIGGGVDLSADFTTDITGATRELPWDIGAFLYVAAGGDTLLVLDDALHAHLADQLSLTQLHNLAMQDSAHANVADNLDLLQIHILELIEDANHDHTADELTIIQNQLLAIVDAAQAHTADNLVLEQLHNLVVEGSDHAHTAENLVVVQQHLLDLFGANHSHVADNLAVLQQHLVSILSAEHSHTADSIDLIQQHLLTLNSADHAHTADVIALVQQQLLAIFDSLHAHYADLIEFAQGQLLVIASAEHAHAAESLALLQQHLLELFSADHNHTADELAIIQQHLITLSDSTHSHSADSLAIIQQHLLTLSSTVHAQIADSVDLVQQHLLSVIDSDHAHTTDNLTLSQIHEIAVNSSLHGHTAGNLTLLLGAIWLAIQDALHGQTASSLPLEQQHLLSIAEAVHAHSADSCDVTMAILLAIADALHAHGAEGISLTQEHLLAADSALHSLFSDNLDLTQAHNLDVADALHSLLSDNVDLLQVHGIDIADSLHTLTSDNITLFIQGLGLGIIVDAGIISLTPQKGKLVLTLNRTIETLTADRSVKHI